MSEFSRQQQFLKMMKRPSMSELDEVISRTNRRDSKSLQRENSFVDRLVKVNLGHHEKRKMDFMKAQMEKFPSTSPSLRTGRNSNASLSGSFDKLSILDPQSKRGSLPFWDRLRPMRMSLDGTTSQQLTPRRRQSVWVELSNSQTKNRTLEIRKSLYREFKMPEKLKRHRPWSPSYLKSESEEDKNTGQTRRMSEPITTLTDKLSDEIEERLASIIGGKSRHSVATVSLSEVTDQDSPQEAEFVEVVELAKEEAANPVEVSSVPANRARRRSELTKPNLDELNSNKDRRRRYSETSMSRATSGITLPPLVENT